MIVPEPRKLPSGAYNIQMRLNGISVSVTKQTAKECKRTAELMKAEYRANKRQINGNDKITLRDAIDKYIDKRTSVLSPSTIRGYRTVQRRYCQDAMDKPIVSVDWQNEINMMSKLYAPKTVKNTWRFFASVIREANLSVDSVTLPQAEVVEREFLDSEQIKCFIKAVEGKPVEIPALLALHSLRRSEIMGLKWKDIDFRAKTIRVSGAGVMNEENKLVQKRTNKNSASTRTIPIMIPALLTALQAQRQKDGYVCTMHPNSIYTAVNSVCRANDLPEVGVHGLRHSFASLAYKIGLTELETMELGGWSDYGTMRKIYTHLDKASKESSRAKMSAFFAENANENANEI